MRNWESERKNNISEHIITTYIIFIFIFFMAMLILVKTPQDNFPDIYLYILLTLSLTGAAIILYTGRKPIEGIILAGRPNLTDISLLLLSFVIAISILFFTGKSDSPVKIVLLIPVIIASTSHGKKVGLVTAGMASALLLTMDLLAGFESVPSVKFQTDIVNSTVMLILAWLIGGLADIERVARENLTLLANTDELTGLSNHRHFQESLRRYFKSAQKSNKPLSLIMFDVNYFKFYNDHFGHQRGDEVLKQIGSILNEVVKEPNIAARYGGDEFTVIVPDHEEMALAVAEKIRLEIESHPFKGAEVQPKGKITVSLGVAGYPRQGSTPKELIRFADEALYKAKYCKDRVQLYFSVMDKLSDGIAGTERELFNSIKTLITIINAKDRYTFGHSERVVCYSLKLGERINLSEEEMISLRYGSFLHDIGKIEIGRDILNKTGPLKSVEWAILKKHPVWGSDIVRPLGSLKKAIPVILHHHENFDGTGYPDGLVGEEIPLLARILRLADSFDAMTTDRPYKKAKGVTEACSEIREYSETFYDPALVEPFIQIIQENCEHPL